MIKELKKRPLDTHELVDMSNLSNDVKSYKFTNNTREIK